MQKLIKIILFYIYANSFVVVEIWVDQKWNTFQNEYVNLWLKIIFLYIGIIHTEKIRFTY